MERIDIFLSKNGFCKSRNKAKELIKNGSIVVNGETVYKNSLLVCNSDEIKVLEPLSHPSRAGKKLKSYLDSFNLEIKDIECLDVGSSTGGFAKELLDRGAKKVVCVDVGRDQLDSELRVDSRIELYEEMDIREFKRDKRFNIVTCDVSFIGLSYILYDLHRLSSGFLILLFKPQFEVGKNVKRDKKGVVQNEAAIIEAKDSFIKKCEDLGWKKIDERYSEVTGREGNKEIFLCFLNEGY